MSIFKIPVLTIDRNQSTWTPTLDKYDDTNIHVSKNPIGEVDVKINGMSANLGGDRTKEAYFVNKHAFKRLACCNSANIIALGDGATWAVGSDGAGGQLGQNASVVSVSSPVSVVGNHNFYQIVGHDFAFHGLKPNGTAWGWGQGTGGQIGDGTSAARSSPVSVVGNHSFSRLGGGNNFCSALKSDGTAWAWGTNSTYGALGDGTLNNRSSPVSVIGNHSFTQIQGGYRANIALKSDGTLWSWGSNASGTLGDGTATNRSSPVSVIGNHSFVSIESGSWPQETNFCALKADGTAWTWGTNSSGKCGDGTVTDRSSPVSVIGNHSFIKIGIGTQSIGLKIDGSAWTWGSGLSGQLGDNTATSKSSPVSVIGNHSFIDVFSGSSLCCGIKEDGSSWGWGANSNGQLGDNTTTLRSSPVSIVGNWGNTVRALSSVVANDILIWNSTIAGFNLISSDIIDLEYLS